MTQTEIFNKIKEIIVDTVGLDEHEIKLESHFFNDLGCDSLMLSELIMLLEDQFNFSIPDQDAEKLKTVGDTVAYVYELEKNKS